MFYAENFDTLVARYGEEFIVNAYGFPIGINFSSPIRSTPDNHPSFRINITPTGKIGWKDFTLVADNNNLRHLLELVENTTDEKILVKRIKDQIKNSAVHPSLLKTSKRLSKIESCGSTYRRFWHDYEKAFWKLGDMTPEFLMNNNCFPLSKLYLNGITIWRSDKDRPSYLYVIDQNSNSFQAYRPYNEKGYKHFSWNLNNRLLGFKNLKHCENLIITSSYKDVLTNTKINYQSVCASSETTLLPKKGITKLLENFKKVGIMLNNDKTGINTMNKYVELGLIPIWIPLDYPKDPWDIIIKYDYPELDKIIKNYF